MVVVVGLSIILILVLMGYLICGYICAEKDNSINRVLIALYRSVLDAVLRFPKLTLASAGVVLLLSLIVGIVTGKQIGRAHV